MSSGDSDRELTRLVPVRGHTMFYQSVLLRERAAKPPPDPPPRPPPL